MDIALRLEQEWGLSIAQRVLAEIALAEGANPTPEILANLEDSIAFQRTGGLLPELMRSLRVLARVQRRSGLQDAADKAASEAEDLRQSLGLGIPAAMRGVIPQPIP